MNIKDFKNRLKEMPSGIRIIFILSFLALLSDFKKLVTLQPVTLNLYSTNFPKNLPIVWHLYSLFISLFLIFAIWKKSYKTMVIYITWSIFISIVMFLNHILVIFPTYDEKYRSAGAIFTILI